MKGYQQYDRRSAASTPLLRDEGYYYDALGNLMLLINRMGGGRSGKFFVPRADDEDKLCRVDTVSLLDPDFSADPSNQNCSVVYDNRGNVISYVDPTGGEVRKLSYNRLNEIKSVEYRPGKVASYQYGSDGNMVRRIDSALSNSVTFTAVGSVIQRLADNGTLIWEGALPMGTSRRGADRDLYYSGYSTNVAEVTLDEAGAESITSYTPYGVVAGQAALSLTAKT